jgi:hypothetical protein
LGAPPNQTVQQIGDVLDPIGGSTLSPGVAELRTGSWEMFDLPPGVYTLELVATDKAGAVITSRAVKVLHGNPMR